MKSQMISNEAIQKATGKSWQEWFAVLHKMGAGELSHTAIARKLCDVYKVEDWWAQSITVEFERTIGRREVGQTCDGDYQASASKTVAGSMDQALKAWKKQVGNARDFNGMAFANKPRISKTDNWRYWRVDLAVQTKVTIVIGDKGPGKALLAVNHEKLLDKKAVDRWKAYWKDFLSKSLG
ncbi:MAG: hypothetical protein ACREOO_28850 [bacterium]